MFKEDKLKEEEARVISASPLDYLCAQRVSAWRSKLHRQLSGQNYQWCFAFYQEMKRKKEYAWHREDAGRYVEIKEKIKIIEQWIELSFGKSKNGGLLEDLYKIKQKDLLEEWQNR